MTETDEVEGVDTDGMWLFCMRSILMLFIESTSSKAVIIVSPLPHPASSHLTKNHASENRFVTEKDGNSGMKQTMRSRAVDLDASEQKSSSSLRLAALKARGGANAARLRGALRRVSQIVPYQTLLLTHIIDEWRNAAAIFKV